MMVSHTSSFTLPHPVDALFPLFSPEGEKLWVPGWDYRNVMGSSELCEDFIFTTGTHAHAESEAVWIVKSYRPEQYLVQYYKIEPSIKVGIITVQCSPQPHDSTTVTVSYRYVGLSERGDEFIGNFTQSGYEMFIREWEYLLREWFAGGQQ